jgi:hypothetical protein
VILDGEDNAAPEVTVAFLGALIEANGLRVSYREWLRRPENKKYEGTVATRVLDSLPACIKPFVERPGKGKSPRLRVDQLAAQ